jgi:RecA/RadA recombinase
MNRETPCVFFAVNHVGQSLDMFNKSAVTPGGTGLKFHGTVRIHLRRKESWNDPDTNLLKGFISEGSVEKLRFGGRGRKFKVYIVPSLGVHLGMTAMWDCIYAGIAKRTKAGIIELDGKKVDRIGKLVDAAYFGDDAFQPFRDALATYDGEAIADEETDETSTDSE